MWFRITQTICFIDSFNYFKIKFIMQKKTIIKFLFGIVILFGSQQNIFAQTSFEITTDVKISIVNKIGIFFTDEISNKSKYSKTSEGKLQPRNILVTYDVNQITSNPFYQVKPLLNITRNKNNLPLTIPFGSEKELKQVSNNEFLYLNVTKSTNHIYVPQSHFITIVYW